MTRTYAPRDTTSAQIARDAGLSSDGQRNFVEALLRDRDTTGTAYEGWTPDWTRATFGTASAVITYLKTLPYAARKQAQPGFYTFQGHAYKVQSNKAKTSTYALQWDGSSWEYAPGTGRLLADLVPMTSQEAALLGLQSGKCIACMRALGGESLSAKVSAVIGYGEICAGHNGWEYPTGAATQRAFLAANDSRS